MWIKFSILIFVALINIILGIVIISRNNNKDKSRFYFSLMCFSAALWSVNVASLFIINDKTLFLYFLRGKYFFAFFIVVASLLFFVEFPYRVKKINIFLKFCFHTLNIFIMYIIFLSNIFIDIQTSNYGLYGIENKLLSLIYIIYLIILLIFSYYILFLKYNCAQGVNKNRLLVIIIGTLVSFILGVLFSWYFPYINKHHLIWLGPIFIIFMNFSIGYLLFKKN